MEKHKRSVGDVGVSPTLSPAGSVKKQMPLSDPLYGPGGMSGGGFQREIDTCGEASEDTHQLDPQDVGIWQPPLTGEVQGRGESPRL